MISKEQTHYRSALTMYSCIFLNLHQFVCSHAKPHFLGMLQASLPLCIRMGHLKVIMMTMLVLFFCHLR